MESFILNQKKYDFDIIVDRVGSDCIKYDGRFSAFGKDNVIPAWIADMDFPVAEPIQKSLMKRLQHPIYGYTQIPEKIYDITIDWIRRRHGWDIEREWVVLCPGVIPSLSASVLAYTNPGDNVILQPPVYQPFFSSITQSNRKILANPLVYSKQKYSINFQQFEEQAQQSKLFLFCSPHNPVGRVWNRSELDQIINIANKNNLTIVSDEIHSDLILSNHKHHTLGLYSDCYKGMVIAMSPSKTFNIPGLNLSTLIIPDKERREKIIQTFKMLPIYLGLPFNLEAYFSAYREGEDWLTQLLEYLSNSKKTIQNYIENHIPEVKVISPEGTYLMWLDFRELQMSDKDLHQFLISNAGVGLSPGTLFGVHEGSGFMRLNFAAPIKSSLSILEKIKEAISNLP